MRASRRVRWSWAMRSRATEQRTAARVDKRASRPRRRAGCSARLAWIPPAMLRGHWASAACRQGRSSPPPRFLSCRRSWGPLRLLRRPQGRSGLSWCPRASATSATRATPVPFCSCSAPLPSCGRRSADLSGVQPATLLHWSYWHCWTARPVSWAPLIPPRCLLQSGTGTSRPAPSKTPTSFWCCCFTRLLLSCQHQGARLILSFRCCSA